MFELPSSPFSVFSSLCLSVSPDQTSLMMQPLSLHLEFDITLRLQLRGAEGKKPRGHVNARLTFPHISLFFQSLSLQFSVVFSASLRLPVILHNPPSFSLLSSHCAFLLLLPSLPIYSAADHSVLSCFISQIPTDLLSLCCFQSLL